MSSWHCKSIFLKIWELFREFWNYFWKFENKSNFGHPTFVCINRLIIFVFVTKPMQASLTSVILKDTLSTTAKAMGRVAITSTSPDYIIRTLYIFSRSFQLNRPLLRITSQDAQLIMRFSPLLTGNKIRFRECSKLKRSKFHQVYESFHLNTGGSHLNKYDSHLNTRDSHLNKEALT